MALQSRIEWKGLARFMGVLERGKARIPPKFSDLTRRAGGQILDLYKDNLSGRAPSTAAHPLPVGIRTGTLLEGAKMTQVNQYRVDVENDVPYAGFIEAGTYKMAPRRPLKAAVDQFIDEDLPDEAREVMVEIWRE